jgi:hypothetical protein
MNPPTKTRKVVVTSTRKVVKLARDRCHEVVDIDVEVMKTTPSPQVARNRLSLLSSPNFKSVQQFTAAAILTTATMVGAAMGLSTGGSSPSRDTYHTQFIAYGGQGSLTQALGSMPITQVFSPGSDWLTTVFLQEYYEEATVEEDYDDIPP